MFGSVTLARNESRLERNETRLERNETRLERNETRLARNETRLARNETRGGNLHLSGTVYDCLVVHLILLSNDCSLSSTGWAVNYLLTSGTEEEFDNHQLCLRVHIFCLLVWESLFYGFSSVRSFRRF